MNQFMPGSYDTNAGYSGADSSDDSMLDDDREGKFVTVTDFLDANEEQLKELNKTKPGYLQAIEPGVIIRVTHKSRSEIHNRVLVVKRNLGSSYTCYTFCRHHSKLPKDQANIHRRVESGVLPRTDPHPERPASSLQPVLIELNQGATPRSDITLNIGVPWNVESGVPVTLLGHIPEQEWRKVCHVMNVEFTKDEQVEPKPTTGKDEKIRRKKSVNREKRQWEKS